MNATDCSFTASRAVRFFAAIAAACTALGAGAETYTLGAIDYENNIGSAGSPWNWSTASNWNPAGVPGSGDSIQWAPPKTGSHRHAYISLNGDYTVGSLEQNYRTLHLYKDPNTVAETVSLTFATQLGGNGYQNSHELNAGVKLVVLASATYNCSPSDHAYSGMDIKSGAEADIYGSILSRVMKLDVNGGTLVFAPASYAVHEWGRSQTDHDEINIASGAASFPNGITMTGTFTEPNQVNQTGGTATFGGDITSQIAWTYTWSGGTLAITDDSTFGANVALVIPASASVSLDIASGKTFAAPGLSADSTASITVTGGGTFSIAPTTASIILQNGSLGIATSGTYDLSNVSVGSGAATIALTAFGATINSLPAALASATFIADLSNVAAGTVILNSSDPTVLAKVKSDLDASAPAGMTLAVSGTTLSLEAQSAYAFTTTGDLLGAAGWGGAVPPAGVEVSIECSGVVATYASGEIPAWTSITVKNGATLRVTGNATLPPVILNKSATLEIDNNATLTLANAGDISGIAAASQVPVLSVASGATLNVPGGMKFSNVNISLAGTIAATTAGGITFGYAAAGETTYIGLAANGGTISIEPGSGSYDSSPLEFCCPEAGGSVIVPSASLTLTSTTINPLYVRSSVTYTFTDSYRCGFHMGMNNPMANAFEVVFDNTKWGVGGKTFIKGGATFRLVNGGSYQNFEIHDLYDRRAEIAEMGRVIVGNGSEFRLNAMGNYGTNPLLVNPASAKHQAIVVEDCGVFECYSTEGNGNGVFMASNCVYRIYMPYIHYVYSSEKTYDTTNIPFAGFQSVSLGDNSTFTFTTRNKVFWDAGQFDENSGDRVVALADVPITGAGSIALDNANVNKFGVIVTCGSNTATGSASVVAPGEGEGETTLYFADGANWAGTVTAGGFVMTNLVNATAACTNSFGKLNLASGGEVKIRVWKTGDAITTHDGLNVGKYINNGGRITLVQMGEQFVAADKFILGTIDDDSPLPAMSKPWRAERDGEGNLFAKASSGLSVVIR